MRNVPDKTNQTVEQPFLTALILPNPSTPTLFVCPLSPLMSTLEQVERILQSVAFYFLFSFSPTFLNANEVSLVLLQDMHCASIKQIKNSTTTAAAATARKTEPWFIEV